MKIASSLKMAVLVVAGLLVMVWSCSEEKTPAPAKTRTQEDSIQVTPEPERPTPDASEPELDPEQEEIPKDVKYSTGDVFEKRTPNMRAAIIVDVRTGLHDGFDRVVFEFEDYTIPGYYIGYLEEQPRQCGSGKVVNVAGNALLQVRLEPAQAHTLEGQGTVGTSKTVRLDAVKELQQTCDFEGVVTWVIGVKSVQPFAVYEFANPSRLVIDIVQ